MSILTDWAFWTALLAGISIVLSQMAPVRLWFKGRKLSLQAYNSIALHHEMGSPLAQMHLILTNDGGQVIRISAVHARFTRDDRPSFTLPLLNYLSEKQGSGEILFTPVRIPVGSDWSETCNFFRRFGRDSERTRRAIQAKMQNDIFEKRRISPDELAEADPRLVAEAASFFDQNFMWEAGEYLLDIEVEFSGGSLKRSYGFTLFESQAEDLRRSKERYKYGEGVYYYGNGGRQFAIVDLRDQN